MSEQPRLDPRTLECPPAGASFALDAEGDEWDHLVGDTLRNAVTGKAVSMAEVGRDYGPLRWFDALGNAVAGGGA